MNGQTNELLNKQTYQRTDECMHECVSGDTGVDAARDGASQGLQPQLLFGVPMVLAGRALSAGQPAPHVCSGT